MGDLMQPAERPGRFSPLFWRVVALNAAVLAVACVVTLVIVSPRKLTSFAVDEAFVLAGALALIAIANLLLVRRAFSPLERVARLAAEVDPTQPGQRVPVNGDRSEAGLLAIAFNDMLARLERERRQSARRALQAQEQERLRVAQELHDEVGQTLTAVLLQLSRLTKDSPDPVKTQAVEAQASVRASLEDVRRIALELRPEALDDLGLPSALAALGDRLSEHTGLRIRMRVEDGLPPLSKDAELVIYRVAQEALTNVVERGAQADRGEPHDQGDREAPRDQREDRGAAQVEHPREARCARPRGLDALRDPTRSRRALSAAPGVRGR